MKYHQKHIKAIGRDNENMSMLAILHKKEQKATKGTTISNQKQMQMAILYGSINDHISKTWIKAKRRENIDINDMHWDFQAAKQYMDNTNLEYIEGGESKQHDSIKNLVIKGKHQYIGCFNTFLKKHTGFNFSISCTGSKDKLEYGDLNNQLGFRMSRRGL
eukprot:3429797-Ditylum_brightwellii.AAC.1